MALLSGCSGAGLGPSSGGNPDLVVAPPSVSDAGPVAGTQFTLWAAVRNVGDGASEATRLRYYQSTDATITTADTEVSVDTMTGIAASKSIRESVELTAPAAAGTYYYGACVDAVTDESDTTNNCSSSVMVTVRELEPNEPDEPDLVVTPPMVSDSSPTAGATFTLTAAVRNDGEEAAEATTVRYYRSTDATITMSDTEVGSTAVAGLAASASSTGSVEVAAPAAAGTYYYGACVDAVADESDTTNNCSSSVTVTVRELEPNEPDEPDLVVAPPMVSDSSPTAGATFTLAATVRNDGEGAAGATTVRYYRSTDATITMSDTEVGSTAVAGLAALASSTGSVEVAAPATAGTYYYGACVDAVTDESDTTNNCSSSVIVTVREPEPDEPKLAVAPPTVSNSAPTAGTTFTLTVTVESADADPAATVTLSIYRSTDATITTSDTLVGTVEAELATSETSSQSTMLAASTTPGAFYSGEVELTAPVTGGTYYYGACTDTDNCSGSVRMDVRSSPQTTPKPDLAVRGWSTSASLPEPGATFTLRGTVWNLGDKASAATTLRWYRSTDATLATSDTSEGTDAVAALAPSGNVDKTVELTAPTSVGTYYYGACVDAVAGESNTTNNCHSTAIMVRDTHLVGIYSLSNAVTEGMSVRFRVTATPLPTVALAVNLKSIEYAVSDGRITYYNWPPAETTLTIGAGSSSTTLTVGTIDDSDEDGNSVLQASVADGSGYTRDPGGSVATVAVVDDDGSAGDSVLSITPVSTPVTEGTAVQFTVGANPAPTAAVTIGYRVWETGSVLSDALDPGWNPGTVTIGAGQTSATLSFATVNDSTDEEDGEVTVTLRVDTYPDGVELGRPAEASVTVLDDD